MADGFDGRFDVDRYGAITQGSEATPKASKVATTWLQAHPDADLSEPHHYIVNPVKNFPKNSKRMRLNTELYSKLFEKKGDADLDWIKKPAKIVIHHPQQRWWNPFTWPIGMSVQCVTGRSSEKNSTGKPDGDLVDTLRVSKVINDRIGKRHDRHGFVRISIEAKNIPLFAYVLMRHPSDDWNLAVRFLYLSTVTALLVTLYCEAYHWPKAFRYFWDCVDIWVRANI